MQAHTLSPPATYHRQPEDLKLVHKACLFPSSSKCHTDAPACTNNMEAGTLIQVGRRETLLALQNKACNPRFCSHHALRL